MGKFVIKKKNNGEFQFSLLADNHQAILVSEGYAAKAGATNGIDSVKANAGTESRYERKQSTNGKFYFTLKATNGQVIGVSELYESEAGRENGISSVKRNAPSATVEDLTV
jgi:uncharacterized protein YegP (UPF0339 family)